jgi:A/G-specific adenine glycosylase
MAPLPHARDPRAPAAAEAPDDGAGVMNADALAGALVAWFHLRRRTLPWRESPSPYRVWVSEIMLQQTQVETVIPYFERFIDRFPDVHALAAAPLDDVLGLWSGLGYYRRARYLHAGARHVVATLGGELPATPEALRTIPGIGPYTAGAIASIAFGLPAPLVDGNVQRVLSRLSDEGAAVDAGPGHKRIWALADRLVRASADPSALNQGLMELGALVCRPTQPDCPACPFRDDCLASARGTVASRPVKKERRPPTVVHAVAAVLRSHAGDPRLLFARRPDEGLLAGLWGLPMRELATDGASAEPRPADGRDAAPLASALGRELGIRLTVGRPRGRVFHQFTHRSLHLDLIELHADAVPPEATGGAHLRWLTPADAADQLALSTLSAKVLRAIEGTPPPAKRPSRPRRQGPR